MYSPVYELDSPELAARRNRLFVKREDLIPEALGGNKVRIADAFFRDMASKHCDVMVAYGGTHSNLCRVIAWRCRKEGVPCCILCSHEAHETEDAPNANRTLILQSGAALIPCSKDDIAGAVERTMDQLRSQGRRPYYIYGSKYGTGNEGVAARAYAAAWPEIEADARALGVSFDYLFLASGTGATQSGLICGRLLSGSGTRIVGISVSREKKRGSAILTEGVKSFLAEQGAAFSPAMADAIQLEDGCRKGGYGLYDREVLDCIREAWTDYGLPLDPIYTGKAFLGMKQYLLEHEIHDSSILFLHTGGTPLFYDIIKDL